MNPSRRREFAPDASVWQPLIRVLGLFLVLWWWSFRGESQESLDGLLPMNGGEAQSLDSFEGLANEATRLEAGEQECSSPVLLGSKGGKTLVAMICTELGVGDRIRVVSVDAGPPVARGEAEVVVAAPREILALTGVVDGQGVPWLCWAENTREQVELRITSRLADGWGEPQRISTEGTATHPCAYLGNDGNAALVWQEYRTPERRYAIRGARAPAAGRDQQRWLTDGSRSAIHPAAVTGVDGRTWLVASEYTGRDYEVMLYQIQKDGTSTGFGSVSADPMADDLHPSLATWNGMPWIAFDSIRDLKRGRSWPRLDGDDDSFSRSVLRLVGFDGEAFRVAAAGKSGEGLLPTPGLLSQSGGVPRLSRGPSGLRVTHRFHHRETRSKTRRYTYPVLSQVLSGGGLAEPVMLPDSGGAPQQVAAAGTDRGTWIAWQHDRRFDQGAGSRRAQIPGDLGSRLESEDICLSRYFGPSSVSVAFVPESRAVASDSGSGATEEPAPAFGIPKLAERGLGSVEPRFHPASDPESPLFTRKEHLRISHEGRDYRVYWGDLHRHSSVSRCSVGVEPRPQDRYDFGRDVMGYDFFVLTDHAGHVDPHQWWQLSKWVDAYRTPEFLPLQGFEWSSKRHGHSNVILRDRADRVFSPSHDAGWDLPTLWSSLPDRTSLTIPHHSAATNNGSNWALHDPEKQRLVEVFQALRGSYEFGGCFRQAKSATKDGSFVQDGLNRGLRMGLIASSDHGGGTAYAAVLAEDLDRASIFDALYERRSYAATTKGMLMDFRLNGALMGQEIPFTDSVRWSLRAQGTTELAEFAIFRNGEVLHVEGRERQATEGALTLVLEMIPSAQPVETDATLTLELSAGRFVSARRHRLKEESGAAKRPGWLRRDARHVEYLEPRGYQGLRAPVDQRIGLVAADSDTVEMAMGEVSWSATVGELRQGGFAGHADGWSIRFEPFGGSEAFVDPTRSLGVSGLETRGVDENPSSKASWYYARTIQVDGEVAWSSPVFVGPP